MTPDYLAGKKAGLEAAAAICERRRDLHIKFDECVLAAEATSCALSIRANITPDTSTVCEFCNGEKGAEVPTSSTNYTWRPCKHCVPDSEAEITGTPVEVQPAKPVLEDAKMSKYLHERGEVYISIYIETLECELRKLQSGTAALTAAGFATVDELLAAYQLERANNDLNSQINSLTDFDKYVPSNETIELARQAIKASNKREFGFESVEELFAAWKASEQDAKLFADEIANGNFTYYDEPMMCDRCSGCSEKIKQPHRDNCIVNKAKARLAAAPAPEDKNG